MGFLVILAMHTTCSMVVAAAASIAEWVIRGAKLMFRTLGMSILGGISRAAEGTSIWVTSWGAPTVIGTGSHLFIGLRTQECIFREPEVEWVITMLWMGMQ